MDLILTHEQADFDALGALLGAALMNEHALAVMPRRMNRNCRAFLALYRGELPFVDPAELPHAHIDTVTLVDTQSLVTLKGVSASTQIQVVDHHSRRPDLPASWKTTLEPTGSCTTLFAEGLRERDSALNPLHATLLLLGIYEDTGSLTYSNTTPRDAQAVSFLLEQGADLTLAVQHLNPALSGEQRAVCDRLLSSAETLTIHNQNVVVASADALEMSDEISTVAHKLRDLLDPAALFIFVRTVEGVRLVARSSNDQIDVSSIAAYFGGGGHDRAAAALIRPPSPLAATPDPLVAARQELLRVLPAYIRPTATVQQIMSRHPQLIQVDTPLKEAERLMQRYGYEGFPVLRGEKIAGLLTRRAVDRALAHKLELTAGSLMEAGEVFVHPDDPIEHLREVMVQSEWGQIPVIDPRSGQVVGIVTRTDLLKQLGGRTGQAGRENLARKLESNLSPTRLALLKMVAAEAHVHHMAIYIVGGFVRDLILGRPGLDFDMVVEGDAIALARGLERRFGGRITTHARFGTAKWNISAIRPALAETLKENSAGLATLVPAELPDSLDLISARTEFYDYPTALPTVERSSIKLDLHRRDFSINTLALRLDGHHYGDLYDYWGGMRDLQKKLLRVLHSLSFVDDPTRQLRAVRFEQRFDFKIEERSLQLMREGSPLLRHLSGDRVRHELNLMFEEEKAVAMLRRLSELDLLRSIHPDLPAMTPSLEASLERVLSSCPAPEWKLPEKSAGLTLRLLCAYFAWLSDLSPEKAQAVAAHIRLPVTAQEMLSAALYLKHDLPGLEGLPVSWIVRRLDVVPLPALYAIYLITSDPDQLTILENYALRWRHIWPETNGETLNRRGLAPGPAYRKILAALRDAWLDGSIHNTEEEYRLLGELLPK